MAEQEKVEAEALREKIQKSKLDAYEYLQSIMRMDTEMLKACGYKTTEEALTKTLRQRAKEIERWVQAHERKFPH